MKTTKLIYVKLVLLYLFSNHLHAQKTDPDNLDKKPTMKTYLIEREIPNAGQLQNDQLKAISQKSCAVIDEIGSTNIQWVKSYITDNKVYCVYKALNEKLIREHAKKGGFPANKISEISGNIDPSTAKGN